MTYLVAILIICFCYKKCPSCLYAYEVNTAVMLRRRKSFCLVVFSILTLLLVLRNDYWGTDTQNYHHLFDTIDLYYDTSISEIDLSTEWGFYSLMYFLKTHGFDFRVLLAISAVSYVACVTYIIYRYSDNVLFSFFLFFTYGFFVFNTTMRQCFALTFIILAVIFAIKKKFLAYMLFLILAILFHSSAIVCIPIFFAINMKLNKKSIALFIIIMIVISAMASSIFYSMQEVTGKEYSEAATSGYVRTFIMVLLLVTGLFMKKRLHFTDEYWLKLFFMALCLQPIAQFSPGLMRVNLYFYFFIILLAPNIVSRLKSLKLIAASLLVAYGLYGFFFGSDKAGIRVYPYVYVWENYFEENPKVKRSDFDY